MWQSIRSIHYLQLCSNCFFYIRSVLPSPGFLHFNEVVIFRFACLGILAICLTYCLISFGRYKNCWNSGTYTCIRHTMPEKHLSFLSTLFSKWGRATLFWLTVSKVILKCIILFVFPCFDSIIKEPFFLRRHSFLLLNFTR